MILQVCMGCDTYFTYCHTTFFVKSFNNSVVSPRNTCRLHLDFIMCCSPKLQCYQDEPLAITPNNKRLSQYAHVTVAIKCITTVNQYVRVKRPAIYDQVESIHCSQVVDGQQNVDRRIYNRYERKV